VHTGDRLVILTANLARDPALFPQPDRFDPTRAPNPKARYLWYGAGPHFCIGFPMAQRVLHAAVARLAQVPGPLRVTFRWPAHAVLLPAWRRLMVAPAAGRAR
jgi:cytochrome P450